MKKRRSSSMSTELQLWTPKKTREPSSSSRSRTMDLAIVPSSNDTSSFTLPEDWIVEKRKRTCGYLKGNVDRYYHEPGTGKKLRSLISVKRYLTEPGRYEITSRGDIKPKMHQIDAVPLSIAFPGAKHDSKAKWKSCRTPPSSKSRSLIKSLSKFNNSLVAGWSIYSPEHQIKMDRSKPLKLPDGWFIRQIPRMSGRSMGRVDKYYCERATGLVFRSKLDVQRYLAENYLEENITLSELFKPAGLIQWSRSEDKDADEESVMAIVPHSSNMDLYSSMSDDIPLKYLIWKSDDVPAKDLVRKSDDVPLKDLVRKSEYVPLKDLVRKGDNVPLNDHDRNSDEVPLDGRDRNSDELPLDDHARMPDDLPLDGHARISDDLTLDDHARMSVDVPLEECIQESDNVLLKDLVLKKPSVARKIIKKSNKSSSPKTKDLFSATKTRISSVDVPNQPMKIKWILSGAGGDGWSPFISDRKVSESLKQEWTEMFSEIVTQNQLEASISDAQD